MWLRIDIQWKDMRFTPHFAALVVTLGAASVSHAHITQDFPAPRTSAQKTGPCGEGGSTRGAAQIFEPGETITVEWTETVEHPGHYRIAFDIDGEDFPLPNNPDDDFDVILVDQIPDRNVNGGGDRTYSQEITFPDVECDNCTLQLIQIMTTSIPYNSFYFQCSDIQLSRAGGGGDSDAGVGGGASDAGGGGGVTPTSGGCQLASSTTGGLGLLLLALAYALRSFSPRPKRVRRPKS